jgi:hypothetical protein
MATTIVVSPLGRQAESTREVIKLDILVTEQRIFDSFDRIEVWRSIDGQGGPYEPLTASSLLPARKPLMAGDPPSPAVTGPSVVIVGESLAVVVDQLYEVEIVFTGSDPLTYGQVAQQIIDQGQARVVAYVSSLGELVIQSTSAGTSASLKLIPTDGSAKLGLFDETPAYGRDARPNLISGTYRYAFEDQLGSALFFYKIRFINSATGGVSEFSLPHGVGTRIGVSSNRLICGIANLIHGDGRPMINQPVHLHAEFNGSLVDGKLMVGTDVAKLTDEDGHVEFMLVRGQKFSVSFPGTSLFRTITVPTDETKDTFNLLDPELADDDVFKVASPEIIVAERRSL